MKKLFLKWLGCSCIAAGLSLPARADTVAFFTFDGITGPSFTDATGNGYIGTLGVPDSAGAPAIVPGPSGAGGDNAILMSGDGGMAVDDSALLALDIFSPFTIEGWFKTENYTPVEPTGLVVYGAGNGGYSLQLSSTGNIQFDQPGVETIDTGIAFPNDEQWHHLALVNDFDTRTAIFYLDGSVILTQGVADNNFAGQNLLLIGRRGLTPNNPTFQGAADRIRISSAALPPNELDSVAAAPKAVSDDTIAYFDFDGGKLPFPSKGVEDALTMITARGFASGNTNAPTLSDDTPSGLEGDFSLRTGGGSHALILDPNKALEVGGPGNDMTLEAWVKYEASVTNARMVIFYYGPGAYSYSLSGGNPRLMFVTALRIVDFSSSRAAVTADAWHHVALVHRAGVSFSFYVDGQFIEEDPYTQGIRLAEVNQLTIGAEPNGILPFNGWIDRVRISNVALEPAGFDSNPAVLKDLPAPVLEWSVY